METTSIAATTAAAAYSTRPAGACVRCRRIKTKCTYPEDQTQCRSCARGGYDCVFISKAERTAERRRRRRRAAKENVGDVGECVESETWDGGSGSTSSQRETSQLPRQQSNQTREACTALSAVELEHELDEEELSPELLEHCQELLRKFMWPFSPVHWPTFQKQLANRTVERSLYYALLASASRAPSSSPGSLAARFGSPEAACAFFAARARRCVLARLDSPSLADVQALLLVILIDWGTSHGTRAFMYLGLAARMALTFLPEADHRLARDFLAAETARRTIWMVFAVEQFLCSGNGRIPAIRAHELCISLPCPEMDFAFGIPSVVPMFDGGMPPSSPSSPCSSSLSSSGTVGELGFMIQISRIWNMVATCSFQGRREDPVEPQWTQLEKTLLEWRASLPPQYQDRTGHLELHVSLGTGLAYGFSHCVYHCALVFLQRERLYAYSSRACVCNHGGAVDGGIDGPSDAMRDSAIEAIFCSAERIIEMINTLEASATVSNGNVVIFPLFMLYACFTASSAIAYISIKKWTSLRQASFGIVRESLRILGSMRSTWPLVVEWHGRLTSLVKVLQDRALGLGSAEALDPPFERLQYGHVRPQTPITPIGAPASDMMGTVTSGELESEGVSQGGLTTVVSS